MENDIVTLHVNKKGLIALSVAVLYVGSMFGAYKYGFKSGVKDVLAYLSKVMAQQAPAADEGQERPSFEPGVGSTK